MWKENWGYKEGYVVCLGLFLTGIILQSVTGGTDPILPVFPANVIAGVLYVGILTCCLLFFRRYTLVRWMGSCHAAIPAMVAVVTITVVMGLTSQFAPGARLTGLARFTGFSQMLSSWPFSLLMLWMNTLLGMITIKRILRFRSKRDIPFVLNHAGLFIALMGAILGSSSLQRLEMTTIYGNPEWRARDKNSQLVELPIAIELHNFTIDYYAPKLMLVDNVTGKLLPAGKPVSLLLEEGFIQGYLQDWRITILSHLPMAAPLNNDADSVKYVEYMSRGATCAVHVEATNTVTGQRHRGWLSCGSFVFPFRALRLDDQVSIVMPEREPARYASEVSVYTRSGRNEKARIEVNKPLRIEGWTVYQVSYDTARGTWSETSIFELVRDPWLPVVYTGIMMMLAGALALVFTTGHVESYANTIGRQYDGSENTDA